MNLSMSNVYPTFTYNNETVIMIPGNQFTIKQLRSRLNKMDVDAINIDSKEQLVNLYESSMKDDTNNWGTDSPSMVSWGYVTACGIDLAELSLTPDGESFMRFPITTSAICVYEDGYARAGTQGDIAEAMIRNDVVFVNMFRGSMISIAIIK